MHAREHITTEMCLYLIQLLTGNYGKRSAVGRRVTKIVNSTEIWIIPMVNPDGAMYDISSGAFQGWRKNRQTIRPPRASASTSIATGATSGAAARGRAATQVRRYRGQCAVRGHRGSAPARLHPEPPDQRRTADHRGVQRPLLRRARPVSLRLHQGGRTSGHDGGRPRRVRCHGQRMASLNGYHAMQGSHMYIYDGDFIDWAYGDQGIFVYTWEMYPGWGCKCGGFHPPDTVSDPRDEAQQACRALLLRAGRLPIRRGGARGQVLHLLGQVGWHRSAVHLAWPWSWAALSGWSRPAPARAAGRPRTSRSATRATTTMPRWSPTSTPSSPPTRRSSPSSRSARATRAATIWAVKISDHVGVDENEPEVLFRASPSRSRAPGRRAGTRDNPPSRRQLPLQSGQHHHRSPGARRAIVKSREIWIVPMVNPDGAEYDISDPATGSRTGAAIASPSSTGTARRRRPQPQLGLQVGLLRRLERHGRLDHLSRPISVAGA